MSVVVYVVNIYKKRNLVLIDKNNNIDIDEHNNTMVNSTYIRMQAKWQDRFNVDDSWHEYLLCPQMIAPAIRNKATVPFAITYEKWKQYYNKKKRNWQNKKN